MGASEIIGVAVPIILQLVQSLRGNPETPEQKRVHYARIEADLMLLDSQIATAPHVGDRPFDADLSALFDHPNAQKATDDFLKIVSQLKIALAK